MSEQGAWITSLRRRLEQAQSGIPAYTLTVRREELEALFAYVAELEEGYRAVRKDMEDAWRAAGAQHREMIEAQSERAVLAEQVERLRDELVVLRCGCHDGAECYYPPSAGPDEAENRPCPNCSEHRERLGQRWEKSSRYGQWEGGN